MKSASALDDIDRRVISCLQRDPRCAVAQMSEETGIPQTTVRNRLGRLLRDGTVEITVAANPLQLGYENWAMVAMKVPVPDLVSICERLSTIREVYFVGITTGSYNIMLGVVLKSNEDLVEFMTETIARFTEVKDTYTFNVLRVFKRSFSFEAAK